MSMGAGGKEHLSDLVESWHLTVLSSFAFPFLCSSSLLISFHPLKCMSFLPRLPCIEHQLLPAEAGAFSWSRSWIIPPAASRCIYCTPDAAPFIYGICSDHLPGCFFSSTISWIIQDELVAYTVLVKLMISGVLTVKVWQRPQVIFLDTSRVTGCLDGSCSPQTGLRGQIVLSSGPKVSGSFRNSILLSQL